MIGRIRGQLVATHPPEIMIDVGGVGYELQVPMTTLFQLPELGSDVCLLTHFVVRDDAQQLFGFLSEQDRRLFRELIKVSGVGPKLALTLLSGMDAEAFARCLERDDANALTALPGVGRKTAERLLIEMRDKAGKWLGELAPSSTPSGVPIQRVENPREEAEQALIALGYKPAEAAKWVASVEDDGAEEGLGSAEIIRLALRASAPGGKR